MWTREVVRDPDEAKEGHHYNNLRSRQHPPPGVSQEGPKNGSILLMFNLGVWALLTARQRTQFIRLASSLHHGFQICSHVHNPSAVCQATRRFIHSTIFLYLQATWHATRAT